jgi:hypothetical protein
MLRNTLPFFFMDVVAILAEWPLAAAIAVQGILCLPGFPDWLLAVSAEF